MTGLDIYVVNSFLKTLKKTGFPDERQKAQISCQDLPFPDGFDLKNKSKPWIRSVDYHLECCIEVRF